MSAQMNAPRVSDMTANLFLTMVIGSGAAVLVASLRNVFAGGLEMRHLAWLGIATLTLLVGRLSVNLPIPHCRVSFADAFTFLSVLLFGIDFATLTAALDGYASSTCAKGAGYKRAFNTAGLAISVNVASRVFGRLLPQAGLSDASIAAADLLLPVAAMALTQYVLNTALVSVAMALKEHASLMAIWEDSSPWAGTAYLAGSLAAAAVFLIVRQLGVASAFAIVPFPGILYFTYRACLGRVARTRARVSV